MEAQLQLFETTIVERVVWGQLPVEARSDVGDLFAGLLFKLLEGQLEVGSEVRGDR